MTSNRTKTHGSNFNKTYKYLVKSTDCLETIKGEVLFCYKRKFLLEFCTVYSGILRVLRNPRPSCSTHTGIFHPPKTFFLINLKIDAI